MLLGLRDSGFKGEKYKLKDIQLKLCHVFQFKSTDSATSKRVNRFKFENQRLTGEEVEKECFQAKNES